MSQAASATGSVASDEPHSPQNFVPGELGVAHTPQTTDKALPQLPQNFLPSSFSTPQFEQIIGPKGFTRLSGDRA